MLNLVQSKEEAIPINTDVVNILESMLEKAKDGKIADLAVCYVGVNGIAGNNFSYSSNKAVSLLGALQVTQRDILDRLVSIEE